MSKRRVYVAVAAAAAVGLVVGATGRVTVPQTTQDAERAPGISPDYAGITLPPNIAPLNFVVREPGKRFVARLRGPSGNEIRVASADGRMRLPVQPWRRLLEAARGGDLAIDVYARNPQGTWVRFAPIRNHVAAEKADDYLVYRRLGPLYNMWTRLGIYQRDLRAFDERPVIRNGPLGRQCVNCHTFLNNRPDTFLFQTRPAGQGQPAMVLVRGDKVTRVDTRTPGEKRAATYVAWHPGGDLIAFSFNKIRQFFHTAGSEPREVVDLDSGLGIYSVEKGTVSRPPALNPKGRLETFPAWAPDGRHLYYSSAPTLWPEPNSIPHAYADRVRYDLRRTSFDPTTGRWGTPETVLSAAEMGKSILEPRVSPDGRFVLVTVCDYGSFPIMQQHTDLYVVDLQAKPRRHWRLEPGTETQRDSWHSWSSNGRWIVFSRKRDNGALSRPYLRYVDAQGQAAKAFVVPQEDPTYYDRCLQNFNAPELITGPVRISPRALAAAVRSLPLSSAVEGTAKW